MASLVSSICFVAVESNVMLQDDGLDGSVANIAVKVDCCEFVSTASFFWSILYTRAVSGISFAGIVSLSRDSLKTNLRSQFAALSLSLSRSWFRHMCCANFSVSSSLRFSHLQVLPHYQPIPSIRVRLPWGWKGRPFLLALEGFIRLV